MSTADLLLVHFQGVSVLHLQLEVSTLAYAPGDGNGTAAHDVTHRVGVVMGMDADTIEEETDALWTPAASLAEGVHQLLELRCPLDLEEDLVVVVGYFDVEVFDGCRGVVLSPVVGSVVGGHGGWFDTRGRGELSRRSRKVVERKLSRRGR